MGWSYQFDFSSDGGPSPTHMMIYGLELNRYPVYLLEKIQHIITQRGILYSLQFKVSRKILSLYQIEWNLY